MTDRAKPSGLKRAIEQRDACGRFRYPNDMIAYDCHGCGEWAEKQIIALRAKVAELTVERDRFREMFKAAKLSVCDLEAKLDKRDEPLTDEQAERAFAIAKENGVGECDTLAHGVQGIDAAIRRVRRGE